MNIAANPKSGLLESPLPELKITSLFNTNRRPGDGYSIELMTGEAVLSLIATDIEFQQSWDQLYESCPWVTIFQSRKFITAWYQSYKNQHLPILVIGMEGGQLKGVLPMALLNTSVNDEQVTGKSGRITGAGHYEAEYQVWITGAADGDVFIKKAMTELVKRFDGYTISLRFLPPGTPFDWAQHDKKWSKYSIIQSYDRPIINLRDPEVEKSFRRRKHFKHKLNRVKKLGEFRFERIEDYETFKTSLDDMAELYNFRQSAMFNKYPFREDPAKKEFLLEMFRLNLLHVTVMRVNGKIMAAIVLVVGGNWAHLAGINCHAPFYARMYSPGFLHFILLGKQLSDECVPYFDLSPGYDTYKDDLANLHDEVHELVISTRSKFLVKRRFKKWLHARMVAWNMRPMTVELKIKWYAYMLKRWSVGYAIKGLAKKFQRKKTQKLYLLQSYSIPTGEALPLHKNNLEDLMQYEFSKGSSETKWEFLSNAMRRLETGQHCYTWMENGRLLACAWFSYAERFTDEVNNSPAADKKMIFKGLYCHPAAKSRLPQFINSVIDVAVNEEKRCHFQAEDNLFCKALAAVGSPLQ
ncbi:GNAT family N-acetyltransferase [Longitalea luteola]|uniref:GNAT family N-acetyltransferase n=1 Tax=Longitalea luteola TaxID=2812563 RepID=UPI001A9599B0|nr:GNAT family N-acetyltransferase [Longitalea luteola]